MKTIRIIPRLDIKGPNLVKGIHLEGLRVLGKPEEYAEQYYKDGCDELIVHDVAAQLLNKLVSLDSIKKISKNIFVQNFPYQMEKFLRRLRLQRSQL